MAKQLSPNGSAEQISGWLKRRYPGDPEMQIPHETIYRSLFVQARGVLRRHGLPQQVVLDLGADFLGRQPVVIVAG